MPSAERGYMKLFLEARKVWMLGRKPNRNTFIGSAVVDARRPVLSYDRPLVAGWVEDPSSLT